VLLIAVEISREGVGADSAKNAWLDNLAYVANTNPENIA